MCSVMSDCIPPGSSVCGIFQARILEWVAISTPSERGGAYIIRSEKSSITSSKIK